MKAGAGNPQKSRLMGQLLYSSPLDRPHEAHWDSIDPACLAGVRIIAPADLEKRKRDRATSLALADLHFVDHRDSDVFG